MQLSHGPRREHRFQVISLMCVRKLLPSNGSTCYNMKPQQCFWKAKLHNDYRRMQQENRETNWALELMGFAVGCHAFFRSTFSTHVNIPNFPRHTDSGSARVGSMCASRTIITWCHWKPFSRLWGNWENVTEPSPAPSNAVRDFPFVLMCSRCGPKKKGSVVVRGNLKWAWKEVYFPFLDPIRLHTIRPHVLRFWGLRVFQCGQPQYKV
jgi:hypothetical protein